MTSGSVPRIYRTSNGSMYIQMNNTLQPVRMEPVSTAPISFNAFVSPFSTPAAPEKEKKMSGHMACTCHKIEDDGPYPTYWRVRRVRVIRQTMVQGVNLLEENAPWYGMEDPNFDEQENGFLLRNSDRKYLDSHATRHVYEEEVVEQDHIVSIFCSKCGHNVELEDIFHLGDTFDYVKFPRHQSDVAKKVVSADPHSPNRYRDRADDPGHDDDEDGDDD